MSDYNTIKYQVENSIATVTLNRPDAANSINVPLAEELKDASIRIHNDSAIRAVIITATGKMFSAGGDLASMAKYGDNVADKLRTITLAYTGAGLSPDGSSTYVLPRLIGMRKATDLMMTNKVLSAEEALEWGLISEVVTSDELMNRAIELATQLANGPSLAYGQVKRLLMNSFQNGYETQLQLETDGIAAMAATRDGKEGITAFLEKRKPEFIGK